MTAQAIDDPAFRRLLEQYRIAWTNRDYSALRLLWHPCEDEPWWFPEELAAPLVGWEAIEAYWRDCERLIERFGLRTSNALIKPIAADLAIFRFEMKWTAVTRGAAAPIGGDVKVSGVVRRDQEEWRFVHYMEAALGPLPFVRIAYARAAEPDLLGE
jgi:hypothetical protein